MVMRARRGQSRTLLIAPITIRRRRQALLGGFLVATAALGIAVPLRGPLLGTSGAVPALGLPGLLLVQGEPPGSEQRAQEDRKAQFEALNQVLEHTRARLQELTEATATVAADTEVLTGQIWRNRQLDESLARAETARKAAVAEAEKTRAEMAQKLEAATDAAAQSRADLAGLHQELEANDKELATAKSAREEVEARVRQLEEVVERSAADVERLKTELAALKGMLSRAVGAAVEVERARQAMSHEAESLRSEAARARDELRAAKTEIARLKAANAELGNEIASWSSVEYWVVPDKAGRRSWTSVIEIETAHNPIMMEEKIEEVNAALDLALPEEATPAASAPTMPVPPEKQPLASESTKPAAPEDERSAATQAPSIAQPRVPAPASETGAGQPADSPVTRSEVDHPVKTANATSSGELVAAPVSGQVVFAAPFKSYGPLLIIAHDEYQTIVWGLAKLDVMVGDRVAEGQTIGLLGGEGGSPSVLQVERRRNGNPIDLQERVLAGPT